MQIPRERLLHKSRSVVKFCDTLSIHCFQLARVVSVCLFFLCPVVEVFVHTSHTMSHRTWFRALDQFVSFSCATCLLDSANQKHVSSCLISASIISVIQRIDTFTVVAELLDLQPYSVGLCETHPLTPERTLSIIDRRRSDGGIGTCTPLEKEHGSGSWLRRPQTHTDLERERCQVGIMP